MPEDKSIENNETGKGVLSSATLTVDLSDCSVTEDTPLPEPWQVLCCADLVHTL